MIEVINQQGFLSLSEGLKKETFQDDRELSDYVLAHLVAFWAVTVSHHVQRYPFVILIFAEFF
jgi:hypothetical protein